MATIVLHNYFRLKNNEMYCPSGFIDAEMSDRNIAPGDWRSLVWQTTSLIMDLLNILGSRYCQDAISMRDFLRNT